MHGQRSSATRVDEPGGLQTRPPRPLRGHPSSREEGKSNHPDHPAAFGGTPPQERRGNQESPSAAFCLAMSSAIPRFASASRASICAVEKGSPSARPRVPPKPPHPSSPPLTSG